MKIIHLWSDNVDAENVKMNCSCSSCRNCIELQVSDFQLTDKLKSQVLCIFCQAPLSDKKSSRLTSASTLIGNCGHMFHTRCLDFRANVLKKFPIRCPKDGNIISSVQSVHVKNVSQWSFIYTFFVNMSSEWMKYK